MIASEVVTTIRRLLEEDRHSQRQIARLVGVSRGTVNAIASGRRADRQPRPPIEGDPLEAAGPPIRCGGCGAKVYMPCVLCHVREELAKRPTVAVKRRPDVPLELIDVELRPEHRARYEKVRRARLAAFTS